MNGNWYAIDTHDIAQLLTDRQIFCKKKQQQIEKFYDFSLNNQSQKQTFDAEFELKIGCPFELDQTDSQDKRKKNSKEKQNWCKTELKIRFMKKTNLTVNYVWPQKKNLRNLSKKKRKKEDENKQKKTKTHWTKSNQIGISKSMQKKDEKKTYT